MSDRDSLPPHCQDQIREVEELFGPEAAEQMRRWMLSAKPCRVELNPVTGRRRFFKEDE